MSESGDLNSQQAAADTPANRDLRWPRLVANSLWWVISDALGFFSSDLIGSVWNHNFTASILSGKVFLWLGKALAVGLFFGVMTGFSSWLAQEIFGRPNPDSSQRPGA
jgi:hypothetical protein